MPASAASRHAREGIVGRPVASSTSAEYRSTATSRPARSAARYAVTARSMFCGELSTTTMPSVSRNVSVSACSTAVSESTAV